MLVEKVTLKALVVRAQKEVKSMGKKANIVLENISIMINIAFIEIGTLSSCCKVSKGNTKHYFCKLKEKIFVT